MPSLLPALHKRLEHAMNIITASVLVSYPLTMTISTNYGFLSTLVNENSDLC